MLLLVHSGISEKWWGEATGCFCYLRNIQDELADGKSPYETRCGAHPISTVDKSRLHQRGTETFPIIFSGYVLNYGGCWTKDHRGLATTSRPMFT